MANVKKKLGETAPSATTLTDHYTVPSGKMTTGSTITVCNRSATPTSYRLSHAAAGAADALAQYFAYDMPIEGNDTHSWTIGIALAATDKIRCYATLANLSFNTWGVEEDV